MSNFSLPSFRPYAQNDDMASSSYSLNLFSPSGFQNIGQPSAPCLEIVVQPKPLFRYRYDTEMMIKTSVGKKRSSHGSLNVPTVHLLNFKRAAIIRCCLYQSPKNCEMPKLHPFNLWRKTENGTIYTDPIDINVNENNNWTAEFTGLSIIRPKQKNIETNLNNKMKLDGSYNNFDLSSVESHRAVLGFDAFEQTGDTWAKIAGPKFSIQIRDSSEAFIN